MVEWLKITEVAKRANLPETVVRKYAKTYNLPSKDFGKTKKYSPETVKKVLQIAAMVQDGLSTREIKKQLDKNMEENVALPLDNLMAVLMAQQEAFEQVAGTIERLTEKEELTAKIEKDKEIDALREELAKLRKEYKRDIQERDKRIMEKVRTAMQYEKKVPWMQGVVEKVKKMVDEQINRK